MLSDLILLSSPSVQLYRCYSELCKHIFHLNLPQSTTPFPYTLINFFHSLNSRLTKLHRFVSQIICAVLWSRVSIAELRRLFQVTGNSHSSLNSRSCNSFLDLWRHRACMQHRILHKTCPFSLSHPPSVCVNVGHICRVENVLTPEGAHTV